MIPATILAAVVGLVLGPITATLADDPPAGSNPVLPAGARLISNVIEATLVPADTGGGPGDGGPGGGGPGGGGPGGGDIEVPPGEDPAAGPGEVHPLHADADTTITTADGRLTVTVPQGAVPAGSTLRLRALPDGERPAMGAGLILVDDMVYEVTILDPAGNPVREFPKPLNFAFTWAAGDLPDGAAVGDLQVFYWDEKAEAWIALPSHKDTTRRTATVSVDHLTVFGLLSAPGLTLPVDMAGHWAEEDVFRLVSLGVITGYEDGTFRPALPVSRVEFTVLLTRALGLEPVTGADLPFRDPIPGWAAGYLTAAVGRGLVGGYDDGTFRPDEPVTREAAAAMLVRALSLLPAVRPAPAPGGSGTWPAFTDAADISAWAAGSVALAVERGLITGFDDGTFRPQEPTTRAQAAALVARLLSLASE